MIGTAEAIKAASVTLPEPYRPKLSVVGLGKLGQPFAVCLATSGFRVLGIDRDISVVESLKKGKATIQEPRLQHLLNKADKLDYDDFDVTHSLLRAITDTDITFILVGTPSNPDGSFSPEYIVDALDELGQAMVEDGKDYHTFVIGSTISPGTSSEHLIPTLEKYVNRSQFGFAYCPELVALGNVVNGFLHPDFVTIGCDEYDTQQAIRHIYDQMSPGVEFALMSVVEAEIFKVSLNFFLTLKISFANTVAGICEQFPGADVDMVTGALGLDSRISGKFLKGGLGFGGFCFPRDVQAFKAIAPYTIDEVNDVQNSRVFAKAIHTSINDKVSVLGLSFKPGTPEIEKSPAMYIVERLVMAGKRVVVHDPMAMGKAREVLGNTVEFVEPGRNYAFESPVVVIATAWPEYAELEESDFQEGATVIDCWRLLKHLKDSERVKYIAVGMG